MLIPSDIRVSRNPLEGDLNVTGGEEAIYAFSKFPNVPVAVCSLLMPPVQTWNQKIKQSLMVYVIVVQSVDDLVLLQR